MCLQERVLVWGHGTGWAELQTLPLLTQELLVTDVRAAFHPKQAGCV